jgi:hypothetical protein
MRLLQCVLAFSVSLAGLMATHADADVHCLRGQKAVQIGFDFHRCDPVAWTCRSRAANRHWGEGWSDNLEKASQIALSQCNFHGGQGCSKPSCTLFGSSAKTILEKPTPKHPVLLPDYRRPDPNRQPWKDRYEEQWQEYRENIERAAAGQPYFRRESPHGLERAEPKPPVDIKTESWQPP